MTEKEIINEIHQISIFVFWNKYKPLEHKKSLQWLKKELEYLKDLYWDKKEYYKKITIIK